MEDLFYFLAPEHQALLFRYLVMATLAVIALRRLLIPMLTWLADFTETKRDNEWVRHISVGADTLATWLDTLRRIVPRVGFDASTAKEPITTMTSRHPPPVVMIPGKLQFIPVPPPAGVDASSSEIGATLAVTPELPGSPSSDAVDDASSADTRRTRYPRK